MKQWAYLVILLLVILAVGCSNQTWPDTVAISRTGGIGGIVPPLERTVSDRDVVGTLYSSVLALPSVTPGTVRACPSDRGIKVQLKFQQRGKTVLEASADTGGCQDVTLTDGRVFSALGTGGTKFWSLLASAAGVSKSDLIGSSDRIMKTTQDAVNAVLSKVGSQDYYNSFPRTTGTKDGYVTVGGPVASKLPVSFDTAASAIGEGDYQVTLTQRWRLNNKHSQTTWTFKVHPDGTVDDPVKSGDVFPMIK